MSENDRRICETIAADMLAKHGYQTLPERRHISLLERRYFDSLELTHLFRVNLYYICETSFPAIRNDTRKKPPVHRSKQPINHHEIAVPRA